MKKQILTSALLSIALISFVQAQTGVHFGLKAGYSMATQYGITPAEDIYTIETSVRNGFSGGIFLYFPISEAVGIQQEILYAMKGSSQDVSISEPIPINTVSDYELNYLDMPILIKYRFVKIKSVGIYGSTGIAMSLLLNGEYTVNSTIDLGGPPVIVQQSGELEGFDTFDYSFVYGAGADFKLFGMDFFLDFRFTLGFNTLEMPTVEGEQTVPLRNQNYVFALGVVF